MITTQKTQFHSVIIEYSKSSEEHVFIRAYSNYIRSVCGPQCPDRSKQVLQVIIIQRGAASHFFKGGPIAIRCIEYCRPRFYFSKSRLESKLNTSLSVLHFQRTCIFSYTPNPWLRACTYLVGPTHKCELAATS